MGQLTALSDNRGIRTSRDVRRIRLTVVLGLLALALLYTCSRSGTATPESSPPGYALLVDTFSPPNAAWARFETEESAVTALAGELYLEDLGKGIAAYTQLIGKTYDEVKITVDVRQVQGTLNNWMGVICGHQDDDNYYLVAISADGYYLILGNQSGFAAPLSGPESTSTINTGKAENRLEVSCEDTQLTLRVNGELVAQYMDRSLKAAGQVALFADAIDQGQTTVVAFDNFSLSEP